MWHSSRTCSLRRELEQPQSGRAAGGPNQSLTCWEAACPDHEDLANSPSFLSALRGEQLGLFERGSRVSSSGQLPPVVLRPRSAWSAAAGKSVVGQLGQRGGLQALVGLHQTVASAARCTSFRYGAVLPNPSFKPSPNGVPRGPGWRYAVHFRHPGPRVSPLVPA